MRKGAAQRMREVLNRTGAYRLTGETSGDWELNAMGTGLDRLSEGVDLLLSDLFVEDASTDHLDVWEGWLRPQRSQATTDQRRRMLRERLAVHPGKGSLAEYADMLWAAGVLGRLRETGTGLSVEAGGFLGLTETEVRRELDELLPAHLPWEIEPVFNWLTMEATGRTFRDWDALNLTWEELDSLTREEILEKKG